MRGILCILAAALTASVGLVGAADAQLLGGGGGEGMRPLGGGRGSDARPPDVQAPPASPELGCGGRMLDPTVEEGKYLIEVQVVSSGYAHVGCTSTEDYPGPQIESVGGGVTLRTEPLGPPVSARSESGGYHGGYGGARHFGGGTDGAPTYTMTPLAGSGQQGQSGGSGYGGRGGLGGGGNYAPTPLAGGGQHGQSGGGGYGGGGYGGGGLRGGLGGLGGFGWQDNGIGEWSSGEEYATLNWAGWSAYAADHPCVRVPGYGVALSQVMAPGEAFARTLGWPDDDVRYYMERTDGDTFRRVPLVEAEGYDVNVGLTEREGRMVVALDLTRRAFVESRFDATLNAYLALPTVMTGQCSTEFGLGSGHRTILIWQPSPLNLDIMESVRGHFAPQTVDETALLISITPGGHPVAAAPGPLVAGSRESLVGARTPTGRAIRIEMLLFEAEVGTDGWRSIVESGDAFAGLANAFAHEYAVTPVAAPVLLCREGEEASLSIGDDAPGGVDAVGLGDRIRVTPEDAGDGRIVLALTWEFHGPCLADPAGEQAAFQVMASQQVRAHFTCEPGGQQILRGVFRLPMRSGADDTDGLGAGGPIERFLRITPTLAEPTEAASIQVVPSPAPGPIHVDVGLGDRHGPRTYFGRYQEF